MTESAYSLRKPAMGLMTVGTTLMKITATVILSSWNYWFRSKWQDKRMNLVLKIITKNSLSLYMKAYFQAAQLKYPYSSNLLSFQLHKKKWMALSKAPHYDTSFKKILISWDKQFIVIESFVKNRNFCQKERWRWEGMYKVHINTTFLHNFEI